MVLALAFSILFALGACLEQAPSAPSIDNATIEASVTRAMTGDALDARVDGQRTAVGYVGIETLAPTTPCGFEALTRNAELAADRVWLEPDPVYEFDARGLRLFHAYTAGGISIEETLVREGLARAQRTDAAYGEHLAQLQAEAEANAVGCLWSGGG